MMDINERQILKPWSVKEAIPVKQAGEIARRCAETVRMWAEDGIDGPPHPIWRGSGQARRTVEGCGHHGHAPNPETVLCTRWAVAMERKETLHG